jgi:CBS domain-containing protein
MSSIILTVGPAHTLREAATKMEEKGTGAAVVHDDEQPGPRIITERDILISLGQGQDPDSETVGNHMSDSFITAAPDWSLEQAAAEMTNRGIRHLVVVDGGELVGVLSMRDIVRCWTAEGATSGSPP